MQWLAFARARSSSVLALEAKIMVALASFLLAICVQGQVFELLYLFSSVDWHRSMILLSGFCTRMKHEIIQVGLFSFWHSRQPWLMGLHLLVGREPSLSSLWIRELEKLQPRQSGAFLHSLASEGTQAGKASR